jgi:fimbrial chaperone protein
MRALARLRPNWLIALVCGIACMTVASAAMAGSLRVAPILLEVPAPGATTTLNLRNEGDRNLRVQIRIFRWTGTQAEPTLEPTTDVVVSPPAAMLTPGTEYVVRVVRVNRQPVASEESYRVLVDEIPDGGADRVNTIRFAFRYSIPVFFPAAAASAANVSWSMAVKGNTAVLTASNSGGRRARLANLKVIDGSGKTLIQRPGLLGYALGKSATAWTLPATGKAPPLGPLRVVAESETGAINAVVALQPSR